MNASANATPAAIPAVRTFYWSVRRELWENRSIYIAPLIVAAVILLGFLISTSHLPHSMRVLPSLAPVQQRAQVVMPYNVTAFLILMTAFLVAVFYCLDALHGERRDRSILFWKSLPVSDLTTVLSKACIPLVVLPALIFLITVATQTVMLLLSILVLQITGLSAEPLLRNLNFGESSLGLLYCLVVIALWYAPIYGWLLLVSSWARRTPFLWAFLPLLAVGILEKIAFNTAHFASMLGYRFVGWFPQACFMQPGTVPVHPLAQLTPGKFLATPGLWIGLLFAAAFLLAAARLRRYRGPI